MKRRGNGKGTVVKLSGNRVNPYVARILVGYDYLGRPILHQIGSYATQLDGWIALEEFHKHPRPVYISNEVYKRIETYPTQPYNLIPTNNVNTRKAYELHKKNATFQEVFEMLKEEKFPTPEEVKEEKLHHTRVYGKISWKYAAGLMSIYRKCIKLYDFIYADLRLKDFQGVINEHIQVGLGDATIANFVKLFKHMDETAIKNEIITTSYAQHIKFISRPKKSTKTVWSHEEIQKLKDAPDNLVKDVLLISLYTGCRLDEILSLYTKNICLSKDYMIGGIKTKAGMDREIPIHPVVKPIISKYYNPANEFLLSVNGSKINPNTYGYYFYKFRRNNPGIGNHTTHECRHTFRTKLEKIGVKQVIINSVMGHSNGNIGLDVYTHITLEEKINAVNMIDY